MKKWELAKYLIDAKKDVDSVWYIAGNVPIIANINLQEKVNFILRDFYVNCCNVVDNAFPKQKKKLCDGNETINRIYYERDKKYAHKDEGYKPIPFNSLKELSNRMKAELVCVLNTCKEFLPEDITLDFVPHDRELFRFINGLTRDREQEILKIKHPNYNQPIPKGCETFTKKPLYDIDTLKELTEEEKNEYCVIMENGLNSYEGVQTRQDACIKINLLTDRDMWVTPNMDSIMMMEELKKHGLVDQFEILQMDKLLNSQEARDLFNKIVSNTKI